MRINPEDPTYSKEVLTTTERIFYLHVIVIYHPLIKYQIIFVWKYDRTQLFCLCYNCGLLDVIFLH